MEQKISKKDLNRKAAIAGVFFVFMQLIVRGISFIVTPIYTRLVTTEQYGEIRVFESWLLILVPLMSLSLYRSVERAKFDFKEDFHGYVASTVTLSYISIFALFTIITLFFRDFFMKFCDLNGLMYLVMILYCFSYTAMFSFQSKEKQLLRYKNSSLATVVTMIPATILSVLLIFVGKWLGHNEQLVNLRVIGFFVPQIVGGFVLAFLLFKQAHFKVNIKYWKYALSYSVPLIPEMLSLQIMNQSDKIMIQKILGAESVGIFSLATTVTFIIWVIENAVWDSWLPWLYEKIERNEIRDIQKPWYTIVGAFGYFSWLMVVFAPEIVYLFGGKGYENAVYLIAPMVTGTLFRFFSNSFTAVENYNKKTQYSATGTVCAMLINVVLNAIFIQKFGYQAAAYTTTFSYFMLLLIQGLLEKKVCGMRCVSLSKMIFISIAFFIVNILTMLLFLYSWIIRCGIAMMVTIFLMWKFYPMIIVLVTKVKKK